MIRVPFSRLGRAAPRTFPALPAATTLLTLILSSCIAPAPAQEKNTPAQPVPVESSVLGRPDAALALYQQSLSCQPLGPDTRILHARLLMIAGCLPDAREELDLVLGEQPQNASALYSLAALGEIAAGKSDPALAGEMFARALASDPDTVAALRGAAGLRAGAGDWGGAEALYTRAIEIRPDDPLACVDRGQVSLRLSRLREATADFDTAVRLDPSQSLFYALRARALELAGDPAAAAADRDIAVALNPGSAGD